MNEATEAKALAQLQRLKASYQSHIKREYEHAAQNCQTCPTRGVCCTDEHFVNVHITRLEAVAIRETLERTPRLSRDEKRAVYQRARETVARYGLRLTSTLEESFAQTFSCPLFETKLGCLVHARAKPSPCIQHACYERWEDLPPTSLQTRADHRVEQLNAKIYGKAWRWLPLPLWLTFVDPESDGLELNRLLRQWEAQTPKMNGRHRMERSSEDGHRRRVRASLPVLQSRT